MTYVYGATLNPKPREEAPKQRTRRRALTLPEDVQRLQSTQAELAKAKRRLEEEQAAHEKTKACKATLRAELTEARKTKASAEVPTAQLTELTAERDGLVEERDSLVAANATLKTLHQVQQRTIDELRAKLVKAENPSAVKALTEEREALSKARESLTKAREALIEERDQLRVQLAQTRKELKRAREQREEARDQANDTDAGLVATITEDGVNLHGHLAEGSTYEQRAAVLNRAVNLLVFTPTPK